MRRVAFVVVAACALFLAVGGAYAADVPRLEWGGFVVQSDSSNGTQNWKSVSSDDGNSVTLMFESLEAKADGKVLEGKSKFSGYFDIDQPARDAFTNLHIELTGYVIKSKDAAARIQLKFGNEAKTFKWAAGTTKSERYSKSLDIFIAGDGKLPDPFKVSAEVYAQKSAIADSALVSLNKLTITASNPAVAAK